MFSTLGRHKKKVQSIEIIFTIDKHPIFGRMNTIQLFVSRKNFSTERQCNDLIHNESEVPEEVKQNFIERFYTTLKNKL